MYRSKLRNLQITITWFFIDLLVSVAYALMVRVEPNVDDQANIQERRYKP